MSRFQKDDWLELGLNKLASEGPEALKLDAICMAAERTKGSFYHHFKDMDAFLEALVGLWRKRATEDVLGELDMSRSHEELYRDLTDLAVKIDFRLELAIRELARRHAGVARKVAETDTARLSVMGPIYAARFSLGPEKADLLARLEYAAFAGLILIWPEISETDQRALADLFDAMSMSHFGGAHHAV